MSEKGKKQKKKQKNEEISENTEKHKSPKKRKTKPETEVTENIKKSVKFTAETVDNEVEPSPKKKRKQQETEPQEQAPVAPLSEELEAEINRPENIKNVASKRAQKREKYEKLKADNKLKSETQMQQRALNYLSLWKHNKQEWKFEKIKQIWLQTHMFDSARIPDEFWDTTVQYFGGSKGKIRQFLIDECMKIVDEGDKDDEEAKDETETEETKYKRARELLQHLQE